MKRRNIVRRVICILSVVLIASLFCLNAFALDYGNGIGYSPIGGYSLNPPATVGVALTNQTGQYLEGFNASFVVDPGFALKSYTQSEDLSASNSASFDYYAGDYYGNFSVSYYDHNYSEYDVATGQGFVRCLMDLTSFIEYNGYMGYNRIAFYSDDFFCWNFDNFSNFRSEFLIAIPLDQLSFVDYRQGYVTMTYREIDDLTGMGESQTIVGFQDVFVDGTYLSIDPGRLFDDEGDIERYFYVESFSVYFPCTYTYELFLNEVIVGFAYDTGLTDRGHLFPPTNRLEIQDYTDWVATAISGFLNLQIFPGFYLSGFLMVIVAFSCVIWFLKIFAGG